MSTDVVRVFSGKKVRATAFLNVNRDLIVTFDHFSQDKATFRKFSGSTYYSRLGFSHLHFENLKNDWFLNCEALLAFKKASKIARTAPSCFGIGFSMGGYGAMLSSLAIRYDSLVLVSPHSALPLFNRALDTRFERPWWLPIFIPLDRILQRRSAQAPSASILFDPLIEIDRLQSQHFERMLGSATTVPLPGGGHPATYQLSSKGHRDKVLRALIGGLVNPGTLASALKSSNDILANRAGARESV